MPAPRARRPTKGFIGPPVIVENPAHDYPLIPPGPLYLEGFEHQVAVGISFSFDDGLWTGSAGSAHTISTGSKHSGAASLHVIEDGTQLCYVVGRKFNTVTQDAVISGVFYMKQGSAPSVTSEILVLTDTANGRFYRFIAGANGNLRLKAHSGTIASIPGTAVADNAWHRVDFKLDCAGTGHTLTAQVDGDAANETAATVSGLSTGFVDKVRYGSTAAADTANVFFDDVYIDAHNLIYPIGDVSVLPLVPASDGTHSNSGDFGSDGTLLPAYAHLTTIPASLSTYVSQTGANNASYLEVGFGTVEAQTSATISSVLGVAAILGWGSTANNPDTGGAIVSVDGAFDTHDAIYGSPTWPADYGNNSIQYHTDLLHTPSSGWSAAYVDAYKLRVGFSVDVAPVPKWAIVILEVAIQPVTIVTVPCATATADSGGGQPSIQVVAPVATATATGIVPTVAVVPVINAVIATATADGIVPVVQVIIRAPPVATATATALPPGQSVIITSPVATATASALVPAVQVIVKAPLATASATGNMLATPSVPANLVLWLDAANIGGADNDPVSAWNDASGAGNNFTQATSTKQPTYKTGILNGLPVVRFDGTSDILVSASAFSSATQGSLFIVYQAPGNQTVMFGSSDVGSNTSFVKIHGQEGSGSNAFASMRTRNAGGTAGVIEALFPPLLVTNSYYIIEWHSNDTAYFSYQNGVSKPITAIIAPNDGAWWGDVTLRDNFTIGGWKANPEQSFFTGDVAAIVMYDRFLTAAERAGVYSYLADRYGFQVGAYPVVQIIVNAPVATATADAVVITFGTVTTINAVPATATAVALVPTVSIEARAPPAIATATALPPGQALSLTAPIATATAAALVPSVQVVINAPVATATATALPPGKALTLTAPLATAIATALVPGQAITFTVPIATATAAALVPSGPISIPAPVALATAAALVPTVRITLTAPIATATATALPPGQALTITSPLATATAVAIPPIPQIIIRPTVATATASALVPGQAISITSPLATATASAFPPSQALTLTATLATATAVALPPSVQVVIRPTVATAIAQAFAPSQALSLTAPLATATASALVPSVQVVINAPVAVATALALPPTLIITLTAPVATATASAFVISFSAGINVPYAAATADAPAPTVRITLTAPIATATASALAPARAVTITAPLATATATALAPSQALSLTAPLATATALAIVPHPTVQVTAPLATATALALVPGQSLRLTAPIATAVADALAPSFTAAITITAPIAIATALALTPTTGTRIISPIATATADALAPTFSSPTITVAPVATATAAALVPTRGTVIPIPVATATAFAFVPSQAVTILSPIATVTASAITPSVGLVIPAPVATAIASALTSTSPMVLTVAIATALASADRPNVISFEGALVVRLPASFVPILALPASNVPKLQGYASLVATLTGDASNVTTIHRDASETPRIHVET